MTMFPPLSLPLIPSPFSLFPFPPLNISSLPLLHLSSTCLAFISSQLTTPDILYLLSLLQFSGKGFNQLGDYPSCLALPNSTYYLANIAMSSTYTNLFMGFCMNKACSIEDMLEISMVNGTGFYRMVEPSMVQHQVDWGSVLVIVLLGAGVLLIVIASVYFKIKNKGEQFANKGEQLLYYFSLQNTVKIFTKQGEIKVINGLRALCFIFVILGHIISTTASTATNILSMKLLVQSYFFTIVISLMYAVDVFFMLGGFMIGFLFLKLYNRNPSKPKFLLAILQRALRFWPMYIIALLFYWKLFPTFGYGPLFVSYEGTVAICEEYWWSDLLFVGNFRDGMCVVWGWYVENDMQFFVVSLVFVFVYFYVGKRVARAMQVATILGSFVYVFVMYQVNQYKVNGRYEDLLDPKAGDIYLKLYIKPWARVSPYILGLLVGISYFECKELKQPTFIERALKHKPIRYAFPLIGLTLLITLTSITYTLSHDKIWPQFFHSLYASTMHFVYPLCYLLIILPILYGYWNPFQPFFENRFFQFIGKITFACYMTHYPYLVWRSVVGYTTPYVSPAFGLIGAVVELVPVLVIGLVVAVVWEFPVAAIIDEVTGKRGKKEKQKQQWKEEVKERKGREIE